MDLLYGTKGFLPVLFIIVAAVALTTDDPATRIVLGVLSLGMAVGFVWEPASRFIAKHRQPRDSG
jgi:hypothetical protein